MNKLIYIAVSNDYRKFPFANCFPSAVHRPGAFISNDEIKALFNHAFQKSVLNSSEDIV